jgi:hypothetical protein
MLTQKVNKPGHNKVNVSSEFCDQLKYSSETEKNRDIFILFYFLFIF